MYKKYIQIRSKEYLFNMRISTNLIVKNNNMLDVMHDWYENDYIIINSTCNEFDITWIYICHKLYIKHFYLICG